MLNNSKVTLSLSYSLTLTLLACILHRRLSGNRGLKSTSLHGHTLPFKVEFAHGPHNLYLSIAVEIVLQGNLLYSMIIGDTKIGVVLSPI